MLLAVALAGCSANGDFGRLKPELVSDDMHAWVGRRAAEAGGIKPSDAPLTDDERQLRDLAYPLIEPPYDRQKWYAVVNEYGFNNTFQPGWYAFDVSAYSQRLMAEAYRSATARYNHLNDDIRDDVERIDPFFSVAQKVIDIDRKREKALAYVGAVPPAEIASARARIAENALVIAWVEQSLADRAEAYRFALERLVVATPMPMAVEVERAIALLRQRIAATHIVVAPRIARPDPPPRPVSMGEPDRGPT